MNVDFSLKKVAGKTIAALAAAAPVVAALVMRRQGAASDYSPEWWSVLAVLAVSQGVLAVVGLLAGREMRRVALTAAALAVGAAGCYEAIAGICQHTGVAARGHSLFPMTGTFYNPGPFGGFLAMAMPVGLSLWLSDSKRYKWAGAATVMIIAVVLPATASRSAWIAAVVSCGLVAACRRREIMTAGVRRWWLPLSAAVVACCVGAYFLKADSADGRLFLWKIGLRACAAHPGGVGWHGVAGAYGDAQEAYFADGGGTAGEIAVAGAPEYLFNEYLQVALAWGWLAGLTFAGVLAAAVAAAVRSRGYGAAGALTAFMIFSFSSYPLQFPLFVASAAMLVTGVALSSRRRAAGTAAAAGVAVVAALSVTGHKAMSAAHGEWERVSYFYHARQYDKAAEMMEPLRTDMSWNAHFMFELGHSLSRSGHHGQSNDVLHEALRVSSDPMPLNIIGNNYRSLGRPDSALAAYRRAADRLPGRMYPYYLMVRLAADMTPADTTLLRKAGRTVLEMPVKVMSPAVRDMRDSTKMLLMEYWADIENTDE